MWSHMESLGRYRVLGRLASGGMAEVLLARTDGIEGFERHVVLKRIRPEYARDPHFIKMFLDEARVAANLHHQHIVQVNDIGETNGSFFFAMEYLHGEDVRAILTAAAKARSHVPLGVVVAIGSAAAAGLHYAHERRANDKRPLNIVHCDVSPSNILIGYDGSIKVVDFGIAKAALRSDDARSGHLKGKASYMSPEQCAGGAIDRRSDVFSLGVVLYELATTTRLFKGPSDAHVMDAIMKGRAPLPRVRRPDLPNELSMIIMRALDTDPNRRYQTADELRLALDRFAEATGLNTSEAGVATALKKMFGERPEPWLDLAAFTADPRTSWVEMPPTGSGGMERPSDLAMGTDRFGSVHARSSSSTLTPPLEPQRASTEAVKPLPFPGPHKRKLAIGVAALAAVAVVLVIALAARGGGDAAPAMVAASQAAPAAAVASTAATPAASPAPAPAAAPAEPGRDMTVAPPREDEKGSAVLPPQSKASAAALAFAAARKPAGARPAPGTRAEPAVPELSAPAKPDAPAPVPPVPAPPPAEVSAAAPAPAAPPAPATPAITAAAAPAAPAIPQLAQGIINRVAWDHSKELSKCDDRESGKGEVSVKFQVTPDGRVTKPQITTQQSNPKLAACILRSLQKWKFPHQAASGAQGVYTIIF